MIGRRPADEVIWKESAQRQNRRGKRAVSRLAGMRRATDRDLLIAQLVGPARCHQRYELQWLGRGAHRRDVLRIACRPGYAAILIGDNGKRPVLGFTNGSS